MLKIENVVTPSPEQWRSAIMGARNPMNSWEKSDSYFTCHEEPVDSCEECEWCAHPKDKHFVIGPNDIDLMTRLRNSGTDHRKFMRMLPVHMDVTAPLYWWKEMDQYRIGQTTNSCSTMHKIAAKEFDIDDFSHDKLTEETDGLWVNADGKEFMCSAYDFCQITCDVLNHYRKKYLEAKDRFLHKGIAEAQIEMRKYWWQMIQLLPSSYNQRRTVMLNYEVLANIYKSRKCHRLDEWREHKNIDIETLKRYYAGTFKLRDEKSLADIGFCDWIKTLPYSELITGERGDDTADDLTLQTHPVRYYECQNGNVAIETADGVTFQIPKENISTEAMEMLEKGLTKDMHLGFDKGKE